MNIRPTIVEFIQELQNFSRHQIRHPKELESLVQTIQQTGLVSDFEELVFQSKFLAHTQKILMRIGPGADGYSKLSVEYQHGLEAVLRLLQNIVNRFPEKERKEFQDKFLAMEAVNNVLLLELVKDLSIVKNWMLDGKSLPFENSNSELNARQKISDDKQDNKEGLSNIFRIAVLVLFLFLAFICIDPPVTVLGWIFVIGILLSIIYLIIQSRSFIRT